MKIIKNIRLANTQQRMMATDIFFQEDGMRKPVVIYAHGFNGFKDWGNFDLIARQFAQAGFTFIKFNFAYNGTTPDHPEEFVDLEAYSENNYTKELSDLDTIISWTADPDNPYAANIDAARIGLIGHSMGGGIVLLQAANDDRITRIATWASISECKTPWGNWSKEKLDDWKMTGVAYILNARTQQNLPLNFQLYEDYQQNQERLDIEHAVRTLDKPLLICHGTADTSVPISSAEKIHSWSTNAELFTVDSDHVFGRKHPWLTDNLPEPMQQVVDKTISFFRNS